MPTNFTMKTGFAYVGTTSNPTTAIPYPDKKGFKMTSNLVLKECSAGTVVGQVKGRALRAQTLQWSIMNYTTWTTLISWIDSNGPMFYFKYFNYNLNAWETKQFYFVSADCEPVRPEHAGTNKNKPSYLKNCTLVIQDTGV